MYLWRSSMKCVAPQHDSRSRVHSLRTTTYTQVVTWLEPLDLLHLARTSKELRALLMSKGNSRLWKAARRNKPGLPDCPPHLSEPRYAASLFDHHCFVSGPVSYSVNISLTIACRPVGPSGREG